MIAHYSIAKDIFISKYSNSNFYNMKKTLLIAAAIFVFAGLYSQNAGVAPLAKGQKQLNFGAGFSNNGLPIYASLDFAVHKDVTVTPELHVKIDDDFKFGAMVKGDYHWNALIGIPSNWDFYSGARVGFDFGDAFDIDLGIQVGGRWYWSEKWGLNLELGGGTGFGTTIGLSMKL